MRITRCGRDGTVLRQIINFLLSQNLVQGIKVSGNGFGLFSEIKMVWDVLALVVSKAHLREIK